MHSSRRPETSAPHRELSLIGRDVDYVDAEKDGARKAAERSAELLKSRLQAA
jgi:hypothetical protein